MKILFLCTANSCRSILSEALFNHSAPAGMRAFSAGSAPSGGVNPRAVATLEALGIDTSGLHSKSVDAHAMLAPDIVVTVCDQAAGDACPIFFGEAARVHWNLLDPSKVEGSDANIAQAFAATVGIIRKRIAAFIEAAPETLDRESLDRHLQAIATLT